MTEVPYFFSTAHPLFATYALHTGVLCTKMFATTMLEVYEKKKKRIPTSKKNDAIAVAMPKVQEVHPDVLRVRRAHLNDLENIPAFIFVSFLYICTEPDTDTAINLFHVYTGARIVHTLVYAVKPVQPARGFSYLVGFGITGYMAYQVIKHFY